MTSTNKYGSFTVTLNGEQHVVNPLTQKELADGWRLVVPRVKTTRVQLTSNNRTFFKHKKNYKIFRIVLSQLPEHLWCKLYTRYEDGEYSHSIAKDGMYLYIVKESPVDREIHELYNYCFLNSYDNNDLDRMRDLIRVLEDNDTSGWVLLRAKMIINQYS
jgi:hypothetical protein